MEQEIDIDEYPSFCKIMFPLPEISDKMKIPPEFAEHIDKHAFEKAMFRDDIGSIWPVKLQKNEKGVFVKGGWDRFFKDHSLGHYELVVFNYDMKTCFDVDIYDKDGLEKMISTQVYSSDGSGSSEHFSEVEIKSEPDVVCDTPKKAEVEGKRKRKRGRPRKNAQSIFNPPNPTHMKSQDVPHHPSSELKQSSKKGTKKEIIETSDEEIEIRFKERENEMVYPSQVPHHRLSGLKKSTKKQIIEPSKEDLAFRFKDIENENVYRTGIKGTKPDGEKNKRGRPFGSKNKKKVQGLQCDKPEYSKKSKEIKEEIDNEIIDLGDDKPDFHSKNFSQSEARDEINAKMKAFWSRFPFFKICISLDDINKKYNVSVPSVFVKKYLPNTNTTIVLKNEYGESWEVKSVPAENRFCRGWVQFMRDNKLKCGDGCLFELVKEKEMKVYIYRS